MSRVERRNFNVLRDQSLYYAVKKENIKKKCRLYQDLIKDKDDEVLRVINGRSVEKLPFMDQLKLADVNLSLDVLHYKLSYCVKHLELPSEECSVIVTEPVKMVFCSLAESLFKIGGFRELEVH